MDEEIIKRFWDKVSISEGCWSWTGHMMKWGSIPMLKINRSPTSARRFSWLLHKGDVPIQRCVITSCGNDRCVKPTHLDLKLSGVYKTKFFHDYINVTENCWLWIGTIDKDGYGKFQLSGRKQILAHRKAWIIYRGPIPDGLCVLHKCDVRNCVRPNHLFLGTNQDNTADMMRKGRGARGEKAGNSILKSDTVIAIKSMYRKNGHNLQMLYREFDFVPPSNIRSIVYRQSWSHLD